MLRASLRSNFLFVGLSEGTLSAVVDAMAAESVRTGVAVIEQGEEGEAADKFYVVERCVSRPAGR